MMTLPARSIPETPDEFTIKELAEKVIELTNSTSELVFKDLPSDDPMQRKPDITLAKEKLHWEPSVQLEEGLQRTIPYFDRSSLFAVSSFSV